MPPPGELRNAAPIVRLPGKPSRPPQPAPPPVPQPRKRPQSGPISGLKSVPPRLVHLRALPLQSGLKSVPPSRPQKRAPPRALPPRRRRPSVTPGGRRKLPKRALQRALQRALLPVLLAAPLLPPRKTLGVAVGTTLPPRPLPAPPPVLPLRVRLPLEVVGRAPWVATLSPWPRSIWGRLTSSRPQDLARLSWLRTAPASRCWSSRSSASRCPIPRADRWATVPRSAAPPRPETCSSGARTAAG